MSRSLIGAACLAACLCGATGAAQALTWELADVSFADNTLVSGTFDFDSSSNTYSNWNISVLAGIGLSAYTYSQGLDVGFAGTASAAAVDFVAFPPDSTGRYLRLTFSSPLTNAGGFVPLQPNNSFECDNCNISRPIVGGAVFAQAVPEPGSWALFGLGLAAVGAVLRRQRRP
jgi:hypothetical protein